jgi:hypothetical protein
MSTALSGSATLVGQDGSAEFEPHWGRFAARYLQRNGTWGTREWRRCFLVDTLPRWAILRLIVNHSTYHRGQAASKLKQFGIEQLNTDFFFWAIEQIPREA